MIEVFRRHDRIPLGLRLCFRKHWNRRQISRRHRLEVEATQPLGVEGRALVGIHKQRAQPPVAVLSNLLCRPVEATHMIIECRLQGTEVGSADALICGPTHTAPSSACEFDPQRSGTPDPGLELFAASIIDRPRCTVVLSPTYTKCRPAPASRGLSWSSEITETPARQRADEQWRACHATRRRRRQLQTRWRASA